MPYQGPQGEWYDDNGNLIQDTSGAYGRLGPSAQPTMGQPGFDPSSIVAGTPDLPTPNYSGMSNLPGVVDAPVVSNAPANTGRAQDGPGGTTTSVAPPPTESTGGGLLNLFSGALAPGATSYQGATIGAAPVFTPPTFTRPPAFRDPTQAEAAAEPGYDFALKQGLGGVEASAAARGVLNSGGTLKDIFTYGNNAATQNYQNVDNRARSNYLLNYQTQYTDPYQFAYRGALDAFAPRMAQYAAENNASLSNASGSNAMNFNDWLQSYNIFRNRQLDTINANTATNN